MARSVRTTRQIYDGRVIKFRSILEARWSYYLDILVKGKQILSYDHEPRWFVFGDLRFGKNCRYLPDFVVTELDGSTTLHETKGYLDGNSVTKLRRMAEYYPDQKLWLIFDKLPNGKSGKSILKQIKIDKLRSRVDRVVDARPIFKQLGLV